MKKLVFMVTIAISLVACNTDPRTKLSQSGSFGENFDTTNSMTVENIEELLAVTDNLGLKATGTVKQYCKGEGCWLTLQNPAGEEVFVEVKDKAFVLPYNIDGKTAFINGVAMKDTTEDGKPQIHIVADGIVLQ